MDYNGLFHVSDFYPTILDMIGKGIIFDKKESMVLDGINQYKALKEGSNKFPRQSVHIHR